jgi:hypothetical protein
MGFRAGDETVEVEARVETRTAKAVLIEPTGIGPAQCWLPKSQIVSEVEVEPGLFLFTITAWIAGKNGLI